MPLADGDPQRPPWQYLLGLAQQWADRLRDLRTPPTSADGIAWNQLPVPRRWHRCYGQSWGSVGPFQLVERCPCGGTRIDGEGPWLYRNCRAAENFGWGPERGGENFPADEPQPELIEQLRQTLREDRHDDA